jgi:hypothetical protein
METERAYSDGKEMRSCRSQNKAHAIVGASLPGGLVTKGVGTTLMPRDCLSIGILLTTEQQASLRSNGASETPMHKRHRQREAASAKTPRGLLRMSRPQG